MDIEYTVSVLGQGSYKGHEGRALNGSIMIMVGSSKHTTHDV